MSDQGTNDRLVRAERRSRIGRALLRILWLAGCVVGLAFVVTVLTLLGSRSGTAHAESRRTDDVTSATPEVGADRPPAPSTNRSTAVTAPALWAEPIALSATAARRAIGDAPSPTPRLSAPATTPERAPTRSDPARPVLEGFVTPTTPVGSMGGAGGGGPPDSGPSIAQLAILAAALMGVRWLSQRVRDQELSWRNALINLSIERPG